MYVYVGMYGVRPSLVPCSGRSSTRRLGLPAVVGQEYLILRMAILGCVVYNYQLLCIYITLPYLTLTDQY
jgi:hypothetical protein